MSATDHRRHRTHARSTAAGTEPSGRRDLTEASEGRPKPPREVLYRRAAGFAVAFALCLTLALDGGGYDAAIRHQIGLVVWIAIAIGLAFGFLPRSRLSTPAWLAIGGFAALAALTTLAHGWTDSDERTTAELARILQYLGFVVLAYLSLNRDTWQGAAAGFAAAALIVPGLAVGSRLFPDTFTDEVARTFSVDRLSYPLDYWNAVACWGAMAIAIGIVWSAHAERLATRCLAHAVLPVAALSVYLTYSRAGIAAAALAVIAAMAVSAHRWTAFVNTLAAAGASALVVLVARDQDQIARATGDEGAGAVISALVVAALACAAVAALTRWIGLDRFRLSRDRARIALAGGAVFVGLALIALQGPIGEAWDEFRNERAVSVGDDPTARLSSLGGTRYPVWTTAVDAFNSDPGRGVGPGSFEFFWNREADSAEFIRDAHSLYLEQLAELGLIGLVALLVALGAMLLAAVHARRAWTRGRDLAAGGAMLAVFIVFLFYAAVDWVWEVGAIPALALGGAAVAGAGGLRRSRVREWSTAARAGAVGLALAAAAIQLPGLVSLERVRDSDELLQADQLPRAEELATEAVDAEPWAASPYAMRALVAEAGGDLDAARADLGEAIEREPANWRHHVLLARVEARAGDGEAVKAELAETARLWPGSPFLIEGSAYRLGLEKLLSARKAPAGGP